LLRIHKTEERNSKVEELVGIGLGVCKLPCLPRTHSHHHSADAPSMRRGACAVIASLAAAQPCGGKKLRPSSQTRASLRYALHSMAGNAQHIGDQNSSSSQSKRPSIYSFFAAYGSKESCESALALMGCRKYPRVSVAHQAVTSSTSPHRTNAS
jgi:hypothetical protein